MKTASQVLTSLLCLTLLASCGWQLRGTQSLDHVSAVYVTAKESNKGLAKALKRELAAYNIDISSSGSEASHSLVIVKQSRSRRTLTVDGSAKASEYMLTETVDFLILDSEGEKISAPQTASTQRVLNNDQFRPMASTTEEKSLRKEMWQTLSQTMIRALGSASH